MRLGVTCVVLVVASLCQGLPQRPSDLKDRLERPSSPEPPGVDDCALSALFGDTDGCGDKPAATTTSTTYSPYSPGSDTGDPYGLYPSSTNSVEGSSTQSTCECADYPMCKSNISSSTGEEVGVFGEGMINIRFGEECQQYSEKCCGDSKPSEAPPPRVTPASGLCGVRHVDGMLNRITLTANNEAHYGEFPWMVAVIRRRVAGAHGTTNNVFLCGGSLISPQVVLTAAHCVHGKDELTIRAGEWDTQNKNEEYPSQDRDVKEVISHEQYKGGSLSNNVALLILQSPVDMSVPSVGIICLPAAGDVMDGRRCVASGWGKDQWGKEGSYQEVLKKVDLPIVPHGACQDALRKTRLGERFKLHHSFICAGGVEGEDTCKGDGGSPLVCPRIDNPQVYEQAGIVSWGIDCGTETPGVYANVVGFVNWIQNKLSERNLLQ